jgi:hypothetical protein
MLTPLPLPVLIGLMVAVLMIATTHRWRSR